MLQFKNDPTIVLGIAINDPNYSLETYCEMAVLVISEHYEIYADGICYDISPEPDDLPQWIFALRDALCD